MASIYWSLIHKFWISYVLILYDCSRFFTERSCLLEDEEKILPTLPFVQTSQPILPVDSWLQFTYPAHPHVLNFFRIDLESVFHRANLFTSEDEEKIRCIKYCMELFPLYKQVSPTYLSIRGCSLLIAYPNICISYRLNFVLICSRFLLSEFVCAVEDEDKLSTYKM